MGVQPRRVVREIFDEVSGGTPLITIEKTLNERGIPSPEGKAWRTIIRRIAMNPAFIGKRVFRGEVVGDGIWDGLVDEAVYWACVRLLEDRPGRPPGRDGPSICCPTSSCAGCVADRSRCTTCPGPGGPGSTAV
jgi:hypothetical protein